MANVRGTSISTLRKILQTAGPDSERVFLASLTPDLLDLYKHALHATWTPIEKQIRLYLAAAKVLFPGRPQPLHWLGRELADKIYSGIFRIFLRIPSVSFVLSKHAQIWAMYFDQGEARTENVTRRGGDMVVAGFASLPREMREIVGGHISVLLERAGAAEVRVVLDDADPEAWRWKVTWA
jgi:hypothetical protein